MKHADTKTNKTYKHNQRRMSQEESDRGALETDQNQHCRKESQTKTQTTEEENDKMT